MWLVMVIFVELAIIIVWWLRFIGAFGMVVEFCDGVYIGWFVGDVLHGEVKVWVVEWFARQEGFDLVWCSVYFDLINDMSMLLLVGYFVAVNFDLVLRVEVK